MQIQGSKTSGALNNNTSKPKTFVKKSEDQARGQRTLSNNVKLTHTKPTANKRVNSFGKSSFVTYSENLKKQSNSYEAASQNASDGAAMIRTATDALKETQAILKRMEEISNQASTDRLSTHDREVLQQEIISLTNTIDDISSTTKYDGVNLFDGDGINKVYKTSTEVIPGTTETIESSIPATFDSKGNDIYKYGGNEALTKEDAIKELQNGNSLYLNAAMSQTQYVPDSDASASPEIPLERPPLTPTGARYSVELGTDTVKFNDIKIKKDGGSVESIANTSVGVGKGSLISLDSLVNKLNNSSQLNPYFKFNVGSNGTSLEVTSFDTSKAEMTEIKFNTISQEFTTTTLADEPPAPTPKPLPDLYEYQGTTKLDQTTAASKLANGEKLYTDAFVEQTKAQIKTDYEYTPRKKVISEYTNPDDEEYTEIETAGLSYKTLNYQLDGESGSKYASVRIERMDSDAIGINNLNITSQKRAEKSSARIRSAREQVSKQEEYLMNAGSRLTEAASINEKNADFVKTGQKISADNNSFTPEPTKDVYADLEQTILDNATKASEDALSILGTQTK